MSSLCRIKKFLDKIAASDIGNLVKLYLENINSKYANILEAIRTEVCLSKKTDNDLKNILEEFLSSSGLAFKRMR